MEEYIKLQKSIKETKYLSQENTYRYRPIMRFFFNKYEQAEYWLYKEDVYNGIKDIINDYSLEDCERDLDFLVDNQSLTRLQDTKNISTLKDFKVHNFRYQLTDYAVVIERMTIELEEMDVKSSSLEPWLFERINLKLKKIILIENMTLDEIYELWNDLMVDFKNLNQQYQYFLKKFYEAKTEELLQAEVFLEYKAGVINHINDFVSSYIKNSTPIKNNLKKIDEKKVKLLMDSLVQYQKKAPKINLDFDYDKLRAINKGKWLSLNKWFIGINGLSEGERLLEATERVIEKIYKYASSLIELHGNMINRKEEYKHICRLFDNKQTLEEAHILSGSVFGIIKTKHYKGIPMVNTDSLVKSYDIPPVEIPITTQVKEYKIATTIIPIENKAKEKEEILKRIEQKEQEKREKIEKLIKDGVINLSNEINLDVESRRYILNLIQKYQGKRIKETEFGFYYTIEKLSGKCKIVSEDGIFEMDARKILIEVGV